VKRRRPAVPPGSPAAELLGYERRYAAAAGQGDAWAAERLISVRSWRHMLSRAGGDPDVGALLLAFAREDVPP
jgi:hypothetical protein